MNIRPGLHLNQMAESLEQTRPWRTLLAEVSHESYSLDFNRGIADGLMDGVIQQIWRHFKLYFMKQNHAAPG